MPNVAHANLTGANLHEPKGAATAELKLSPVEAKASTSLWYGTGSAS